MKYETPVVEIEVLCANGIIMLSGAEIKDSGELPTVSWSDIA